MSELSRELRRGAVRGLGFAGAVLAVWLGYGLLADSLHVFNSGEVVSASRLNANFQKMAPIGTILAWHKNMSGAPALPDGWIECNGQVISDSESPFNGGSAPNLNNPPNAWNSRGVVLRGHTTSGLFQQDELQGHTHIDSGHTHDYTFSSPENGGTIPYGVQIGGGLFRVTNIRTTNAAAANLGDPTGTTFGTPRYGNETRSANMSVVWIMRIK